MQYRLRGRRKDDNSEELVADILCKFCIFGRALFAVTSTFDISLGTGNDRSDGGSEVCRSDPVVGARELPEAAVQLTAGLQSLIEVLEADTGKSSTRGLDEHKIGAIAAHR